MAFNLGDVRRPSGLKHKGKRKGRGMGSGRGKTSGKGHKGAKSRSGGGSLMIGFEGGQMSIIRRMPKVGFNNKNFKKLWTIVNIGDLEASKVVKAGGVLDKKFLEDNGLIKSSSMPLKVLGEGKLAKALTIKAEAFSKGAAAAIKKAGGKAEILK
jgi:large subunit ribosomal protein L15